MNDVECIEIEYGGGDCNIQKDFERHCLIFENIITSVARWCTRDCASFARIAAGVSHLSRV